VSRICLYIVDCGGGCALFGLAAHCALMWVICKTNAYNTKLTSRYRSLLNT
jgi:hypothetical protein